MNVYERSHHYCLIERRKNEGLPSFRNFQNNKCNVSEVRLLLFCDVSNLIDGFCTSE